MFICEFVGINAPATAATNAAIFFYQDLMGLGELAGDLCCRCTSGAQFVFLGKGSTALPARIVFTVIDNRSRQPIAGTFASLADGSTFTANGNDLTLRVVP